MLPAARLGDLSSCPADSHGCPACPHPVIGPSISGSENVNINSRPAMRVGDKGIHAACCGTNIWEAKTGSQTVLINGKPAHRLSDTDKNCGGMGRTVTGSGNVFIGGPPTVDAQPEKKKDDEQEQDSQDGSDSSEDGGEGDSGESDASEGDSDEDASEGDSDEDASEGDGGEGDASEGDGGEGDASEGDSGEGDTSEGDGDESKSESAPEVAATNSSSGIPSETPATPADAPAEVKLDPSMNDQMQKGWNNSFPNDMSQEQGATLVRDADGNLGMTNAGAGESGTFLPDRNVADGQSVVGTFHTHPYDASEGGMTDVSFSGGDAAYQINHGDQASLVQSGDTQFMLMRTGETPTNVDYTTLNNSVNDRIGELQAQGLSFSDASRQAAAETAANNGLAYYEGSGGTLHRVYP